MAEPNYAIAGMRSPEDIIRGLVKDYSGYDVPALSLGGRRALAKPTSVLSGTSGASLPGMGRMQQELRIRDMEQQLRRQQSVNRQLSAQQMEHDRVKRDLTERGLL